MCRVWAVGSAKWEDRQKQKMTLSDTTKGSSTKLYLYLIYQIYYIAKFSYSWPALLGVVVSVGVGVVVEDVVGLRISPLPISPIM